MEEGDGFGRRTGKLEHLARIPVEVLIRGELIAVHGSRDVQRDGEIVHAGANRGVERLLRAASGFGDASSIELAGDALKPTDHEGAVTIPQRRLHVVVENLIVADVEDHLLAHLDAFRGRFGLDPGVAENLRRDVAVPLQDRVVVGVGGGGDTRRGETAIEIVGLVDDRAGSIGREEGKAVDGPLDLHLLQLIAGEPGTSDDTIGLATTGAGGDGVRVEVEDGDGIETRMDVLRFLALDRRRGREDIENLAGGWVDDRLRRNLIANDGLVDILHRANAPDAGSIDTHFREEGSGSLLETVAVHQIANELRGDMGAVVRGVGGGELEPRIDGEQRPHRGDDEIGNCFLGQRHLEHRPLGIALGILRVFQTAVGAVVFKPADFKLDASGFPRDELGDDIGREGFVPFGPWRGASR